MTADESEKPISSGGFFQRILERLTGRPRKGGLGKESGWVDFCDFKLSSGRVQIVDPNCVFAGEGCIVELSPGMYHLQTKTIAYGSDVRVSRFRALRPEVSATLGATIGEVGCDFASIGICDQEVFARARGDDVEVAEDALVEAVEVALLKSPDDRELCGVAVLDEAAGAVMPFVDSGFGDGTYPVLELVANGSRAGFEIVFIESDTPYPF